MDEETEEVIVELIQDIKKVDNKNKELSNHISNSSYGVGKDVNLISTQLEVQELLEKLERFYRGDVLVVEGENTVWKAQENKDLVPLNEYGVNTFMEVVTKYIDKNTTLSNYKPERIFEILADVGEELTLVVYCNYEKMGLDTPFKKTKFRLLVVTTLHTIESAYNRSIDGKTSEDINQSRIVTQSDTLSRIPQLGVKSEKKYGVFDPRRYGG